jgi:CNT family concentrative nucleoside transporter
MIIRSIIGLFLLAFIAWLLGEDRKNARWQDAATVILVQIIFAVILIKLPFSQSFFLMLNKLVLTLEQATEAGTSFVFGYLGGGPLPFEQSYPHSTFILAFQALPLILLVSALSSLLFYWRILPAVVKGFSFLLEKAFKIGGALGLGASANIFVGMVESPLFIRPYIKDMTRSELFSLMTCGMATIAGTVMVLYASVLQKIIPETMGHILVASIISAPAAITVSRLMVPETKQITSGKLAPIQKSTSSMDAITNGTYDGLKLLLNIIAMLIVFVALVFLMNIMLSLLPDLNGKPITLQRILGYVMAPVVWIIGIPWNEAQTAGSLMGTKTILNELLAYFEFANLPSEALTPRSRIIMTYAMCGFANFGSLGIMIGGIGSMVPERRKEIVGLGIKSIIAGTIATCMTGAIAGILFSM